MTCKTYFSSSLQDYFLINLHSWSLENSSIHDFFLFISCTQTPWSTLYNSEFLPLRFVYCKAVFFVPVSVFYAWLFTNYLIIHTIIAFIFQFYSWICNFSGLIYLQLAIVDQWKSRGEFFILWLLFSDVLFFFNSF